MAALLLMVLLLGLYGLNGDASASREPAVEPKLEFAVSKFGSMARPESLRVSTLHKLEHNEPLSYRERREVTNAEYETYKDYRRRDFGTVSNTKEAIRLRNYLLRNRKKSVWKGANQTATPLSQILFPGQTPEEYISGDNIRICANLLESKMTHIPFQFDGFPGYSPMGLGKHYEYQNLGATLLGRNGPKSCPMEIQVLRNQACTTLFFSRLSGRTLRWTKELIDNQYRVHLVLDGMPVLMRSNELNFVAPGYPIGFQTRTGFAKDTFLYNHLRFEITYRQTKDNRIRITGFDVHPVSFDHFKGSSPTEKAICSSSIIENNPATYLSLSSSDPGHVAYTFEVVWNRNDDLSWADRWDVYMLHDVNHIDRFVTLSKVVTFVLSVAAVAICWLIRRLRDDISDYTKQQKEEGEATSRDEMECKLIENGVLHPPPPFQLWLFSSPMVLSAMVGTGSQIGLSFGLCLLMTTFGVANTMKRGQVLTLLICLYALCGVVAGYRSCRIHKFCCYHWENESALVTNWKKNAIFTAAALPCLFGSLFLPLNICLGLIGAATFVGLATIAVLFFVWAFVCLPMVFVGAWIGNKMSAIGVPTETNDVIRAMSNGRRLPKYLKHGMPFFVGGLLPFAVLYPELPRVMAAIWYNIPYIDTDFLLVVLVCSGGVASLTSIVLCYVQLCAEDYCWWFESFANAGACGIYLFLFSLWFAWDDLGGALSWMVYLTTMAMISIAFGLFCGSVGFLSCFWFIRTVHSSRALDETRNKRMLNIHP